MILPHKVIVTTTWENVFKSLTRVPAKCYKCKQNQLYFFVIESYRSLETSKNLHPLLRRNMRLREGVMSPSNF